MQLSFRRLGDGEMDRPPTQRDQFNNDDVELVDALVRESLQNSLDAAAEETVRVRFSLHAPDHAGRDALLQCLDLEQLRTRLHACGIAPDSIVFADPKLLVIEDFGTTGLTGSWVSMDKEPFSDFWRRMGKSHKAGKSLGRWGLGKLVFSSSSEARIFFGLTVRQSDPALPLLMGQAVLTTHDLDEQRFDSHGFFCKLSETGMQLPITDADEVQKFSAACGVSRTQESGLSIVIPYVVGTITEQRIVQAVIRNYFFPILLGKLVVIVGSQTIDAGTFAGLARAHGGARFESGALAQFIGTMRSVRNNEITPYNLPSAWVNTGMPSALGDHVKSLRERYQAGECLCVRAPLLLKQKDGTELNTRFDLFLQKSIDGDSDTLFVRDTIVLTAESKNLRSHRTLAALVADDKPMCAFLGDAENPAHTSWSASAEKVTTEWRNPAARLKEVRGALQLFYNEVVSSQEVVDPNALIDFFSAKDESGVRGARLRGPIVRPPNPNPPPPVEKAYRLIRLEGGFAIRGGAGLGPEQLPLTIRVKAAYDVLRGNPFSKHDPLDFDFSRNELTFQANGVSTSVQSPNILIIEVNSSEFEVQVNGFDPHRDLIIDAKRQ